MEPREFFNAWIGHQEQRKQDWNVLFYTAQYNAMRTAFSEKQAKAAQKDRPPWEKQIKREPMRGKQIIAMLSLISKPESHA